MNVPRTIGAVISSGQAQLKQLREDYFLEDVYTMIEIATVDAHNRRLAMDAAEKKARAK